MPLKRLATAVALIVPVMYVRYATKMPDSATMVEMMPKVHFVEFEMWCSAARRRGFVRRHRSSVVVSCRTYSDAVSAGGAAASVRGAAALEDRVEELMNPAVIRREADEADKQRRDRQQHQRNRHRRTAIRDG